MQKADKMTNLPICLDLNRSRYFGRYSCSKHFLVLKGGISRTGGNQLNTGTVGTDTIIKDKTSII